MPSITDQISKYQNAADGPRNIGSRPSGDQMAKAKNTAIGNIRGTIKKGPATAAVRSDLGMSVSRSSSNLRPSKEGLMHAPGTLIAGNNSGYNKSSLQHARYKQKGMNTQQDIKSLRGNSRSVSRITDFRNKGFGNNSVKRLGSVLKRRAL